MNRLLGRSVLSALSLVPLSAARQDPVYFPPRGEWERREPAEVGMDAEALDAAVALAVESEAATPVDLAEFIATTLANEPHGEIVGPTRGRGAANGVVVKDGYVVAEWGPTDRVDMTFSVTKTYLSTVVGVAWDRGLVPDLDAPVRELVPTEHFASEHNAKITWEHLLRQTSDWRGTLWEKPDWADRPPRGVPEAELPDQPEHEPGATWKYNDVRVNLLALCALEVWREPLPAVLREHVMDPIGASRAWRWHGYETSWVTLDGLSVQSVSGGGHWGGGMWISTWDHARFGYLFLRKGRWGDRRVISEEWIEMARTPTEAEGAPRSGYGFMNWFLDPPSAEPGTAVAFRGAGNNVVYVDWANELVIVMRWIAPGKDAEVVAGVLRAIEG